MVVLPQANLTRYAGPGALAAVIQHEMGHVATLNGDEQGSGHDSLIEGIAEYISYTGHSELGRLPPGQHPRIHPLRQVVGAAAT